MHSLFFKRLRGRVCFYLILLHIFPFLVHLVTKGSSVIKHFLFLLCGGSVFLHPTPPK